MVLCGGESMRMGMPKALLPFGDELMLQRVVRILSGVVDSVVIVASATQQLPPLSEKIEVARDRREGCGPLEGLGVGLTALQEKADVVFVTGCDAPFLHHALHCSVSLVWRYPTKNRSITLSRPCIAAAFLQR